MTERMGTQTLTDRPRSLVFFDRLTGRVGRCVVVLSAVSALAFAAIGSFAYMRDGADGLLAAFAALMVCWIGASLALLISAVELQDPSAAMSRLMFTIVFRTAVPFCGAVFLSSASPRLAEAGVFGLTVGFYLITLATETLLSLGLLNRSAEARKAS